MTALNDNRLVKTFAELRRAGKQTVLPFVTAGFDHVVRTNPRFQPFDLCFQIVKTGQGAIQFAITG